MMTITRTIARSLLPLGFVAGLAAPAAAQEAGDFQFRVFGTAVLPDGEINNVVVDNVPLPLNAQTEASDSFVPTVAIEYFPADNFSLETICCITPHDVDGTGALAGNQLIDNAIILPATVTAKYHVPLGGVKPYIGAGVSYFFIFDEGVGTGAAGLGVTDVDLSDEFGFVLQAGFDVPIGDKGAMFSVDAKRYFIDTTATFRAGNVVALQTEHTLDPWVLSAGFGFRF